ncbi:hypothetical protein V8D89_000262 [Ganoderma adspersum]
MDEDADAPDIPGGMPMDADPAPALAPPAANDDYDMQDVVLTSRFSITRPSEQWEVVMEDIVEVDETMGTTSSKNSLKTVSNGEFGTHTSKSTVSSSIRALANSLGIKRATSKASHQLPDSDNTTDSDTNPKISSFSPGKLLSTRARDSLVEHAIPYADIPPADTLPDTDHFKFSTPDASILAPDDDDGDPANPSPSTIRLGPAAVRSTIRLVSHPAMPRRTGQDAAYMSPPRLPIVQTDFDIVAGTPGTVRTLNMWPASPRSVGEGSLYPKLPLDDDEDDAMPGMMGRVNGMTTPAKTPARSLASPTKGRWTGKSTPGPVDEHDMFSPSKPTAPTPAKVEAAPTPVRTVPRSAPFLFGSPLPRRPTTSTSIATATVSKHKGINKATEQDAGANADADEGGVSNAAFDGVAKSILEEMHRRIAASNNANHDDGGSKAAITPTVTSLPAQPVFSFAPPPNGDTKGKVEERFAKAHAAEFSKMDSITSHYAARRPPKRKSDAMGHGRPSAAQRRRSSAAGARVISAGARRRMGVPGGFGADDDDLSDDEQREEAVGGGKGREAREEDEEDAGARRSSKRIRIKEGWDVHRAGQRVSLAPPLPPADEEKKVKERVAVKRELDAAKARRRSSRGRPSIGAQPAKAKSRFGFFGAAKSLVRNVWGMGGSSKAKTAAAAPAPASANPLPSSIPVPKAAQVAPADKKARAEAVPAAPRASSSAPNARKTSMSQPNKLLKPPPSAADAKNAGKISSTKSTGLRSRSPIPSFSPPPPSGTVKSTMTTASRSSSIAGTTRSRVSSTGTGNGTAASRQTSRASVVSSMGTRTSVTSGTTIVSSMGTRRSTSSTNTLASTSSKPEAKSPEMKDQPSLRKRPSSLLAPTASSLAKTNATVRQSTGRTSGLPPVAEAFKPKRTSAAQAASSSRAAVMSPRSPSQQPQSRGQSPLSPRPTRIFSQPLTNFGSSPSPPRHGSESPASPAYGHPSLTAAAATIMSSPSKIPRPAVLPPKPKQLIARKPRISRSKVIAKLGAQRAAAAQGSSLGSPSGSGVGTRTRSSLGARRSFGGVKAGRASAGAEVMRSAVKKRARQSEYIRRRSRANENESVAGDD